jgi:HSP20 family protein
MTPKIPVTEDQNLLNQNIAEDDYFQVLSNQEKTLFNPQENWLEEEIDGQLSVDVYQTPKDIIVKSTVAGAKPEDLEIQLNNDLLTIRGKRYQEETVNEEDYFYRECYWGGFSRSIVLPVEVRPNKIEAKLKAGILTIKLPKAKISQSVKVDVVEEEE